MIMEYTFSKMSEHSYDPSQYNNLQDYQPNKTHCGSVKTTYVVQTMYSISLFFIYCIRCDEVGWPEACVQVFEHRTGRYAGLHC